MLGLLLVIVTTSCAAAAQLRLILRGVRPATLPVPLNAVVLTVGSITVKLAGALMVQVAAVRGVPAVASKGVVIVKHVLAKRRECRRPRTGA